MRNSILIILTLLASCLALHADDRNKDGAKQTADSSVTEHFAIYYRFDSTEFDPTYLTNGETAEYIRNYLINCPPSA